MSSVESRRVLLVDDEPAIIQGLRRQHRKAFDLDSATSPEEALEKVRNDGPFAAIVSDYNMPGMNGAELLERVGELSPDTSRVLLTGQTDQSTAIDAVNRGQIFRFLSKPCEPDLFRTVVEAAIDQYRMRNAERLVLEQTVTGAVRMLADVLAISNPVAFGRATRARNYVRHIVRELGLKNKWMYETAALLSQVGCVAVPHDVLERIACGETLPDGQLTMLERHPQVAYDLIACIPRLKPVADIVALQRADSKTISNAPVEIRMGSRVLAAVLEYEELVSLGATPEQALEALHEDLPRFNLKVLNALKTVETHRPASVSILRSFDDMEPGMVLDEEVHENGKQVLIAPRGHELTASSLMRLRNYADLGLLPKEKFRVRRAAPDVDLELQTAHPAGTRIER